MPPLAQSWPAMCVEVKDTDDIGSGGKNRLHSHVGRQVASFQKELCVSTHMQKMAGRTAVR